MNASFTRSAVSLLTRLGTHLEVEGIENLPPDGGFIIVSNHLGRLDVILVYAFLQRPDITVMVAEKYRKYAIFRWFVKKLDSIWVDRFNADFSAMRVALNRLKRGSILVIAPEGTRSKSEELIEAKPGSSYLAAKAGAPVVPVALTGTEDRVVVERLKHLRRPRIQVRIGESFVFPPLNSRDRDTVLKTYTDEMMCRIAALLPANYRGFYANPPRTRELLQETRTGSGY
ncbi:MAG: lysophospholipid acyltransferase family protein [Omnitrophica WOR_2 bacterium]